jgi:hypothetical protein
MGGSVSDPGFERTMNASRLPNLIGIGAPKAGTTWLFKCLQEHPQVFMTPAKETNFFHAEHIDGRLDEYREYFRGANGSPVAGEISVRYLHSPRAPQRIAQMIPDARLLISLRNPVEQVYSHYWHLRRQNFHQYDTSQVPETFEDALVRFEDRLIEPALCGDALRRWFDLFDRTQLHVVLFDDIEAQPKAVLRDLYAFAGVDPGFQPPSAGRRDSDVRRGASPRSPLHDRVHKFLYQQLARRLFYRLKLAVGVRRAASFAERVRARHVMESVFYQPGYPAMSGRTRAMLVDRFADDVRELARLTGRDLSHWTR